MAIIDSGSAARGRDCFDMFMSQLSVSYARDAVTHHHKVSIRADFEQTMVSIRMCYRPSKGATFLPIDACVRLVDRQLRMQKVSRVILRT